MGTKYTDITNYPLLSSIFGAPAFVSGRIGTKWEISHTIYLLSTYVTSSSISER